MLLLLKLFKFKVEEEHPSRQNPRLDKDLLTSLSGELLEALLTKKVAQSKTAIVS